MNDQQVKQRIAYLVEHGGIAEDPLTEIHQRVRVLTWLVSAVLLIVATHFLARAVG